MAKRRRVQRHASNDVQGEGSWVITAALTVAEMRAFRARAKEADFDAFELGVDVLKTHVYEWNWVDDDDSPLPQPKDDPEVIDTLTDNEVAFLSGLIQGTEAEAKN
jgi:hypothetical protein